VPWELGRSYRDEPWDESQATLAPEARTALVLNLLTEDNLPYYFRDIERMLGKTGAFGEWTRRWTAEEARHATVIRDYLTVTRVVDPTALENARMVQMSGGVVPQPPTAADGLIYVTLQELATRISHRNTGTRIEEHDRVGHDIMRRVANDENHHFLFYRDMAQAIVDARPSEAVLAMERQVIGFAMPGEGIPDFNALARMIAAAGIYDLALHHEKILEPIVLQYWGLPDLEGLTPEAEQSRERTLTYIEKSARVARRLRERREARESSLVDA